MTTRKGSITMREIFGESTLFMLTTRQWPNRRKADISQVNAGKADKSMFSLSKKLIIADEYVLLTQYMRSVRTWCLDRCMPSFVKDGIYVVRLTQINNFESFLATAQDEIRMRVGKLVEVYPRKVQDARQRLSEHFNEDDYPDVNRLRDMFSIEWRWVQFTVPDNLPDELRQKEMRKLEATFDEARQDIVQLLRKSFDELLTFAVDRLKTEPGKEPPVFRNSLIEKFEKFFDTFNSRNLFDDDELEDLVEQTKEQLSNVTPEALRRSVTLRNTVATKLEEARRETELLMSRTRKFRFDDDAETDE